MSAVRPNRTVRTLARPAPRGPAVIANLDKWCHRFTATPCICGMQIREVSVSKLRHVAVWFLVGIAAIISGSLPASATTLLSNAMRYHLMCGNFTKFVDGYNYGGADNYHVVWKVTLANACDAQLTLYCLAYNLLPDVAGYEAKHGTYPTDQLRHSVSFWCQITMITSYPQ